MSYRDNHGDEVMTVGEELAELACALAGVLVGNVLFKVVRATIRFRRALLYRTRT